MSRNHSDRDDCLDSAFIRRGLRFECQRGNCCCRSRGDYDFVYLTLRDRRLLAKGLRMRTAAFTRKFCETVDGYVRLKNTSLDCPFLEINGCAVYAYRPVQCRTWPFWPENLNPRAWRKIARLCPGIGKGRRYSAEEIRTQATLARKSDDEE